MTAPADATDHREAARRRLDQALVEAGLARSRAAARALVLAGRVAVDGATARRPAQTVPPAARLAVEGEAEDWVSRGALKLAHALDAFAIDPAGREALDLGASTGGFTQTLLARGAARVTAVDVGRGQLAESLRRDPRVRAIEGLNARDLAPAHLPEGRGPEIVTADLSFISLSKALGPALTLAAPGALLVALVKPQFEVGPERVGKGGVVRDPAARAEAVARVQAFLERSAAWTVLGATESPILGGAAAREGAGNVEFLLAARAPGADDRG